jgi:hypothetical protein
MDGLARLIGISFVLVTIAVTAAPKPKAPAAPRVDLIAQAHERVKDVLKDPDSAKFKGDFAGKDGAVCGYVNSKNSYGGYGGFVRYVATAEHVVMDEGESWKMDARWFEVCADFEPTAKL